MVDDKQIYQNGSAFNPLVTVVDDLTTADATKPLSAKQGKELNDKKLNIPGNAPGTSEVLRLPYFFEQSVGENKVTVKAHTVKLDNTINKVDEPYTMDVLPAIVSGATPKAGLYTKTLADLKADKTQLTDGSVTKLGTSSVGGGFRPIYLNNGVPDVCVYTLADACSLGKIISTDTTTAPSDGKVFTSLTTKNKLDAKLDTSASMVMTGLTTKNRAADKWEINTPRRKLDNSGATDGPFFTLLAMDYDSNQAGLYTKAMADKKVDRTVKDAQNASNTIDNQFGQNGCVMQTYLSDNKTVISFNTASENGPDGILGQVYAKDYTTSQGMRINFTKSGAYYGVGSSTPTDTAHEIAVKGDLTSKMDKLPLETYSHTEYKFPFHIEAPVQNQTNITARFHTLVLNDGVTRNQYDIAIPAADITNDKAGLYTKVLADKKVDKDGTKTLSTITLNGSVTQTPTFFAPISVGLAGQFYGTDGTTPGWKSISSALNFKGTCTQTELTSKTPTVGDVWAVSDLDYTNFAGNGSSWDNIGKNIDLSPYQTKKLGTTAGMVLMDSSGVITGFTSNVGSNVKPIFISMGTPTVSDASVGGSKRPMYLNNGLYAEIDYTLKDACALDIIEASEVGTTAETNSNVFTALATRSIANTIEGEISDIHDIIGDGSTPGTLWGEIVNKVSANSAIYGATKTKITYDAKGLVTSGDYLDASDIPPIPSNKIESLDDYVIASAENPIETTDTLDMALGKLEYGYKHRVIANANITPNVKCKITYDAKGLVTGGSDLSATDIPILEISKISGLQTALNDKISKPNTPLTSATKCKITYDANGLVTAGANLIASDIPNIASNKINAMTSYAIGTSYTAITTSDTLNQAIGKLEYLGKNPGATAKLTGYVIASVPSALSASMTQNEAFASLERRIKTLEDANLVRYG